MKSKRKQKTTLSFILIGIFACLAVILALDINQSIPELLKLLAIMLSAGVTNLRIFSVFIVILVTTLFSLPLGLLTLNLINIDKQCASTKLILGISLGIALMTASFTLMGLIGIPITRLTLLTNYFILLLFLLLMNKGKGYKDIVNLHLNSIKSFNKPIFLLFLLLFIMIIYPALRYPAPASSDWMDYGVMIQGIIHSSTITGFYFHDFVHATDPLLLIYPQGFFVFITFLYHLTNIPVHILLLSFGYFTGFMILLMIYTLGYNFFKNKYIAALAVISVLCIEGLSRLDTSGFTWILSLFLSSVFIFLYYETMKKYDFKKALLTGILLSSLFMSNPVIAMSISLVPISYIISFIVREIRNKDFIRIEDIKPHVIPLLTGVILSIPIFMTNYVPMLHIAMLPSINGASISIPIYMRLLNSLYTIYSTNGGVGLFGFPFQSFVLNSIVGIITFLPILFGLFFCLNQRKEYQKLIIVLLFSSLVTYVVPHTMNIPAPRGSAILLFVVPFCLLSAIGISEIYKLVCGSERLKHIRISHIIIVCIILFTIFGFVRTSSIIIYNGYQDAGFLANSANIEAALWLKENSHPNSVILNSPGIDPCKCGIRGDFLPIVSNRETVYTRSHKKIEVENRVDQYWDTRAKECISTFSHSQKNKSYSIWKKHNISHVFVTSHWYDLGAFFESPFLELEYFKDGVAIFKVNSDGACNKSNNLVHFEAEKSNIYGNAGLVDMTGRCYGVYVIMPVGSKIVMDLTSTSVNDRIQKNPHNSEATIRIKHFVGPLHMPLRLSIGNNTRIIDKTSDKFRFITTEAVIPVDTLFQENNLSIEAVSSDIYLSPPSSLLQLSEGYQGTIFFQFYPMVDWIQIYNTNDCVL